MNISNSLKYSEVQFTRSQRDAIVTQMSAEIMLPLKLQISFVLQLHSINYEWPLVSPKGV